jgi:tRNA-splicing ligase RtcB
MSACTQARFLAAPMPDDVDQAIGRLAVAPDVVRIAVMPDVHLAEDVCVGTVVATAPVSRRGRW